MNDNYSAVHLQENSTPTAESATLQYERTWGKLKHFRKFGDYPSDIHPMFQVTRHNMFNRHLPSFDVIFNELVNNNPQKFKEAILLYIRLTRELAASLDWPDILSEEKYMPLLVYVSLLNKIVELIENWVLCRCFILFVCLNLHSHGSKN